MPNEVAMPHGPRHVTDELAEQLLQAQTGVEVLKLELFDAPRRKMRVVERGRKARLAVKPDVVRNVGVGPMKQLFDPLLALRRHSEEGAGTKRAFLWPKPQSKHGIGDGLRVAQTGLIEPQERPLRPIPTARFLCAHAFDPAAVFVSCGKL